MSNFRHAMMGSAAVCAVMCALPAAAEVKSFDIPAQPARTAIPEFGRQSGIQILAAQADVGSQQAPELKGDYEPREALDLLLRATNLRIASDDGRTVTLVQAPQGGSAGGGADANAVDALIVTAQKREENIQDVPIAISAFSQEDLTRSQVAGGPDLITQVPNMTFTKTNFSSYSVQLRGIGTQAISATTDPAVAVAFNNTPFIRNRFFEQEFYDLQRVEVLRGPQGTLYGRNATAGVVNIISAKPSFRFEAKASGDVSNYNSSRLEGMVNIPLVEDKVALRVAGAWTKREGYATNEIDGEQIDGRDLWSSRISLRVSPNDRLDANLIWEHFEENDDRLRSGKQLCKKHRVTQVGDTPVDYYQGFPGPQNLLLGGVQGTFSQGCIRNSLYAEDSFQTPNGISLPYYHPLGAIGLPTVGNFVADFSDAFDPYLSETQSHDLRVIESTVAPEYKAKADIVELQVSFDLTDTLTLASETAYGIDEVFSFQDFNRFNTSPGAFEVRDNLGNLTSLYHQGLLDENGVFCDPQLGCTSRLVAADVATARARQFSQEFRLSSDFDGPFNFSLGANYLRADSLDKYYVFINTLTLTTAVNSGGQQWNPGVTDNSLCLRNGLTPGDPSKLYVVAQCTYIDPNPIGALNDQGHNYFLSNNPYKLISYAAFGEAYYNVTDTLKVTAGLRWTIDKKEAPRQPTWLLVAHTYGYPVAEVIEQEWREPTGRLTIDWKPDLAFTDETLFYASYAHGYKAGGSNPPPLVQVVYAGVDETDKLVVAKSATRPKTFDAEFVDAFELGAKNTLLDGALTLNLAAFYYDYKDYQISEIVDRSAFNRNFDATVWGIELESDWRPLENLRLGLKIGYQEAEFADGERAIDLMDRTAGMPGWMVVKPFPTFASNCIGPAYLWEHDGDVFRVGNLTGGTNSFCELAYVLGLDPITSAPYVQNPPNRPEGDWFFPNGGSGVFYPNYPGFDPKQPAINNGEGFLKDLGGNELPNAPNLTATITADYTIPLPNDWLVNLHTDLHWQAESDWRPFQDHEYSKLDEYFTMNLAAIFTNEERGWNVMAYVKNVTDETAITGAFLNSDDTGLTTNVFLTEPRLYGLRVTKAWSGSPWFEGFDARNSGPAIFTVELGGQVQRQDAPYSTLEAGFEDTFPESTNIFADAQNRDLDWGDGREVKLTWRPNAGPWTVSAGVRYGRTNNETTRLSVLEETETVCLIGPPFRYFFGDDICDPNHPFYEMLVGDSGQANRSTTIWSAANGRDQEKHQLVDFAVGREFGIGGLSRSAVSVGLRHASFDLWTLAEMFGTPDRYIAEGAVLPGPNAMPFHQYTGFVEAQRDFEGTGPTLSWDASLPLLGGDDTGRLELDWAVSGGVLFGKQENRVRGESYVANNIYTVGFQPENTTISTTSIDDLDPIDVSRSEDATVPTAGVSLGLSYAIDRVRVGAGYKWERYFDVLDGGFEAHEGADRTIDGPYFKVSVGFGG